MQEREKVKVERESPTKERRVSCKNTLHVAYATDASVYSPMRGHADRLACCSLLRVTYAAPRRSYDDGTRRVASRCVDGPKIAAMVGEDDRDT